MRNFSFQKILRKSEVQTILQQWENSLGVTLAIFDHDRNCIWGAGHHLEPAMELHCHGIPVGFLGGNGPEFLTAIANVINYVIQAEYEKKQLAKDTLQKYEEVVFLSQFSNAIATCTSLSELIDTMRREIRQAIEVDEIFLFLYDQNENILTPFVYKTEESLQDFKAIEKIMQRVLKINQFEVIEDIRQDVDYLEKSSHIRSLLCSSLTIQNRIIGVLGLAHHLAQHFDSSDLNLFSTLTNQVAAAIQTAQYCETVKNYSQTLENKVKERTMELEMATQQLEQANKQLRHLAVYDELTQIPNRRYFTEYLAQEWRQCLREKSPISIILCDVDHFKNYNDLYGHPLGDSCLKKLAQIVKKCLKRPSDIVARYGGEEFILILPYTDMEGGATVATRIHRALQKAEISHADSKTSKYLTVSLGVGTTIPSLHYQPSDLIKIADQALYLAKAAGRNQTKFKSLSFHTS